MCLRQGWRSSRVVCSNSTDYRDTKQKNTQPKDIRDGNQLRAMIVPMHVI